MATATVAGTSKIANGIGEPSGRSNTLEIPITVSKRKVAQQLPMEQAMPCPHSKLGVFASQMNSRLARLRDLRPVKKTF